MINYVKERHDVIIVGGGAAGLSAALVLARAQADVVVLDAGSPRNAPATQMHGFISRDGIAPANFLSIARDEASRYGATVLAERVQAIDQRDDGTFTVELSDGTGMSATAVLVATGLTDELPPIAGLRERWGTVAHHCPYCHGYEVLRQSIIVIGGPMREMSLKQAGLLRRFSDCVTFVTNGLGLTSAELHRLQAFGIGVVDGEVSHLVGSTGRLDGIGLVDGTVLQCDAAFVAPRQRPNDELLRGLGCATDAKSGLVTVTEFGQTSVPGVWAAGNVVTPTAQVITAAGAASASAIAINGWLLAKDLDAASARTDQR